MSVVLGQAFEQGVIAAAGLSELQVEAGSLRIDELAAPEVTIRLTVVASVPKTTVDALVAAQFGN